MSKSSTRTQWQTKLGFDGPKTQMEISIDSADQVTEKHIGMALLLDRTQLEVKTYLKRSKTNLA
ncbi:hypothetical protein CO660_24435 [Rhizobium sp. L9]|nr:hypothetical protein CO660_24435 [Rhizobium sp. L9]